MSWPLSRSLSTSDRLPDWAALIIGGAVAPSDDAKLMLVFRSLSYSRRSDGLRPGSRTEACVADQLGRLSCRMMARIFSRRDPEERLPQEAPLASDCHLRTWVGLCGKGVGANDTLLLWPWLESNDADGCIGRTPFVPGGLALLTVPLPYPSSIGGL